MELMEDVCPPPEGAKRDEDEDLRIIAELNNPRIYKDVQNVLRQEQRVKIAITRNKSLVYPCKCRQLCEFGSLLSILYDAFEHLYEAYDTLHTDYTYMFRAASITANGKIIHIQDDPLGYEDKLGRLAPIEVNMDDFLADVRMREDRKRALDDEEIWRKTYELHMECVRLCMLDYARPEKDRFIEWFRSHVWANKKCICYHCDYRDALLSYRHALLNLHLEYTSLYASYLALLHSYHVKESRPHAKTIAVRGMPEDILQTMF